MKLSHWGVLPALVCATTAVAQLCGGTWSNQFIARDQSPYNATCLGPGDSFNSAVAFDPDGPAGASLVVLGRYNCIGGFPAYSATRWNGSTWTTLGGLGGPVLFGRGITFDEDGAGPFPGAIYALNGSDPIARWNELSWSSTQPNLNYWDAVSRENGSPHKLFRVSFQGADSLLASQIVTHYSSTTLQDTGRLYRLQNGLWTSIAFSGGIVDDCVSMPGSNGQDLLVVHESTNALIVSGGWFRQIANVSRVSPSGQRSDLVVNERFTPFEAGGTPTPFLALTNFDPDGPGPLPVKTYVGGVFTIDGGSQVHQVAELVGNTLVPFSAPGNGTVTQLQVLDLDGPGGQPAAMYALGTFSNLGGVQCKSIAKWNGESWSALSAGLSLAGQPVPQTGHSDSDTLSVAVVNGSLWAVGNFDRAGTAPSYGVARWDGYVWMPPGNVVSNPIHAMTVAKGLKGDPLVVGGEFVRVNGHPAGAVAAWDGQAWNDMRGGADFHVDALCSGPAYVYAGGRFSQIGGTNAERVAFWNGTSWNAMGPGLNGQVRAIAWSPSQGRVVAGGAFTTSGTTSLNRIGVWAESQWLAFGTGMNDDVNALADFQGDLYAAGKFTTADGQPAAHIARWNGQSWVAVGTGLDGPVHSLAVHDDGRGPSLFVGGTFTVAGGVGASNLARWDGAAWSTVGAGVSGGAVLTLCSIDEDGEGYRAPVLYCGGSFNIAGSQQAKRLARWDGASWTETSGGTDGDVLALATVTKPVPGGTQASLYVGGAGMYYGAGLLPAWHLARLDFCVSSACYPNCDGSAVAPALTANDFQCFLNRFVTGASYANCDGSTVPPVLNANDFQCYINSFAADCP